jgi:hypothetical protein
VVLELREYRDRKRDDDEGCDDVEDGCAVAEIVERDAVSRDLGLPDLADRCALECADKEGGGVDACYQGDGTPDGDAGASDEAAGGCGADAAVEVAEGEFAQGCGEFEDDLVGI